MLLKIWSGVTGVLGLASIGLITWVAPPELTQGYVQKLFYVHVGSAVAMDIGFIVSALGAIWYLWRRSPNADALALAGAEVGLVFCTIVLLTGPIWARPIWGVWWTWDARLTSTLFCWLIFAAYLLVRQVIRNPSRQRTVSAAVAIIGALDIPIIAFAVKLWRGAHPSVLGNENSMPGSMRITLIITMLFLMLLAGLLIRLRYETECGDNHNLEVVCA